MKKPTSEEIYARLYDLTVPDWPGEIDFYLELARQPNLNGQPVLEIACGTGRVAMHLAKAGIETTGLDHSAEMLAVARAKSTGIPNMRWVQADMRDFALGGVFGLVIIPGHSFQFMLTPEDQVSCLENVRRHLSPNGRLVVHLDHQDIPWLAGLLGDQKEIYETVSPVEEPFSGNTFRISHSWKFEPATQTASVTTKCEKLNRSGNVVERWQRAQMPLHCVFRFEMEHLLRRTGYAIEALYGDFYGNALTNGSGQMIWIATPNG